MPSFGRYAPRRTVLSGRIDKMPAVGWNLAVIPNIKSAINLLIKFIDNFFIFVHELVFLRVGVDGQGRVIL